MSSPPNRRALLRLGLGALVGGLAGCSWGKHLASLQIELANLRIAHDSLRRELAVQTLRISAQHDSEIRKLWAKWHCNNQQVMDFIKECENPNSPVCSDAALAANALKFMDLQASAVIYLRPGQGIKGLHPTRHGQLLQLCDSRFQTPSTRYLILAQPRGESSTDQDEALSLGREVLKYLRSDIGLPKLVPILGPKLVPCKLKAEQLKLYSRRVDQPMVGEPKANEPRVRLWVYRTDC